ncbi:hypothetical protein H6P81_006843 [Aristolochia fimbriata]|uniref:Reverse transcriptase domain-containing protein n=1 Tax=Aristolochia fimbriata TaxID=158543 RepID=A0AAV7EZS9_ARIFI|nr:hypothetical protein H6P81_006843 [Aristolochia fimbriata]
MVNHISFVGDNQEEEEFILKEAPAEFEEGGQATVDELKKVDLGIAEELRPTFLSASLTTEEETEYMALLREYRDIFAWNYTEMPPSSRKWQSINWQFIPLFGQSSSRNDGVPEGRLLSANNRAHGRCDNKSRGSFLHGRVLRLQSISVDPKDEELTAFCTPKGIFCYKVMPFGLKNADTTYQRAMQNIFDNFLHKRVKCYVDDLVVKTKQRSDHLLDLRAVFERLQRFQLKMNSLKCAFGVTSSKFLGFIVLHRGIEIDQSKIDAIQKMSEPKNVSELKCFQGHLAYIQRFISNLAGRCQPFSRLLKKDTPFEWDESCRNAFNNIKAYLT